MSSSEAANAILAVGAVLELHGKRSATNDYMAPYTYDFCVECRQTWPCATVAAIESAGVTVTEKETKES